MDIEQELENASPWWALIVSKAHAMGLTQRQQIAKLIGVTPATIGNWASGATPSAKNILDAWQALSGDPDDKLLFLEAVEAGINPKDRPRADAPPL